jgi:hypothetical protein
MISRVTSGGQRLSRLQRENQTLAKGENYLGGKMSFHTRRKNRVRNHTIKGLALAAGAFLIAVALSASANASTLRRGSTGGGAAVTGALPGEVLWTYYETTEVFTACGTTTSDSDGCNVGGNGDNIIRLINPNGAGNSNLAGAKGQTVCAMIYVFDDDEEMGECCGCPLSSTRLATFSVEFNLTSDWSNSGGPEGGDHANGSIAIVASAPNTVGFQFGSSIINPGGGGPAGQCLGFACCDPTNVPGYSVTTASNLLGSVTHNQQVQEGATSSTSSTSGLTEIGLFDDAGGDPTNLVYLQSQCGALVGNGTGGGVCNCPLE